MHTAAALALLTATQIDITPLLDDALKGATLVATGLITWGVKIACERLHIDNQGTMASAVHDALENGLAQAAHLAQVKIDGSTPITLDVKNALAAQAAAYAVSHYKDWIGKLGVDLPALTQTALAKLPQ